MPDQRCSVTLTFFTAPQCTLCVAAKYVVDRVAAQLHCAVQVVDITAAQHAAWQERYCHDIPVLHINGHMRFMHHIHERALREAILDAARVQDDPGSGPRA